MKKLILLASMALVFGSCEKENVNPAKPVPGSDVKSISELIREGNPELYDQIYNSTPGLRAPKPSVKVIHGIMYYPPGHPENGHCLPHPTNPCMLIITWAALVDENTPEEIITENYAAAYTEEGEGQVILNNAGTPETFDNVKSINLRFDPVISGQSEYIFELLEL